MISYPITLPTSVRPSVVMLSAEAATETTESPYTGEQQVQRLAIDRLLFDVSLPPMDLANAEDYVAALLSLDGSFGTCYFGDYVRRAARGTMAGAPVIDATITPSGRMLLSRGWTANAAIAKAGDWIQVGKGYKGTRVKSTGGSTTTKYISTLGIVTTVGINYALKLRVANIGAKSVVFVLTIGGSQTTVTVAAGVETAITLTRVGTGADVAISLQSLVAGDSLDFIAWDMVVQRNGVDENLASSTVRDFTGGGVSGGATVTIAQNQSQRIYKLLADATADASGYAALDLRPVLRNPETLLDGDAIVTANTAGVFRLADDRTDWTQDQAIKYGLKFKLQEAY
jgi:hypothetical protein